MDQVKKGDQKGLGLALFNDNYRNNLKGDNDGYRGGFITGLEGYKKWIMEGIAGSIDFKEGIRGFTENADETINYLSSHDNLILRDRYVRWWVMIK